MVKKKKIKETASINDAWALYYKKKFDEALMSFNAILESGNDAEALYGRACALFRTQDYEGAMADIHALLQSDKKERKYLHTRALIYGANEQYEKSLADLLTLSEQYPDNGEVWCDLGGLYLVMKEFMNARDCFERSADIDKSCSCAWFGKGVVALFLKEYKKATEYLNIALKLDSKHSLAYMARAETAFGSNKKSDALKDMKKVLTLDDRFVNEFREMFPEQTRDNNKSDIKEDREEKNSLNDEDAMEMF